MLPMSTADAVAVLVRMRRILCEDAESAGLTDESRRSIAIEAAAALALALAALTRDPRRPGLDPRMVDGLRCAAGRLDAEGYPGQAAEVRAAIAALGEDGK